MSAELTAAVRPDGGIPETDYGTGGSGLHFSVARSIDEVVEAWRLVHDSYYRAGLIDPNPWGIHTVPRAVSPHAMVGLGRIGQLTVATLTAVLDSPQGLPLDQVYQDELDELRAGGYRLMELGLFADRREHLSRSLAAVFELMRLAFFYGFYSEVTTDAVIGVHPRHARFYIQYFSFEIASREATHPSVKNHPVVLLRLNWEAARRQQPLRPGLSYLLEAPVPREAFATQFLFEPDVVAPSPIGRYLEWSGRGSGSAGEACATTARGEQE